MDIESMAGKLSHEIAIDFLDLPMFARLLTTCTPPQTKHLQFQWLEV
jgi:hypothetical protein